MNTSTHLQSPQLRAIGRYLIDELINVDFGQHLCTAILSSTHAYRPEVGSRLYACD